MSTPFRHSSVDWHDHGCRSTGTDGPRLKTLLAARDIEAFLVRDPLNIIYLSGYWHTTTERPQAVFMNRADRDPWFLYPGLDRDLVKSWWFGGGRMYFDFHHGEDAFPHQGRVLQGKKVEIYGNILPLDYDSSGTSSFILNASVDACGFGGVPRINEWIYVTMKPGQKARTYGAGYENSRARHLQHCRRRSRRAAASACIRSSPTACSNCSS